MVACLIDMLFFVILSNVAIEFAVIVSPCGQIRRRRRK